MHALRFQIPLGLWTVSAPKAPLLLAAHKVGTRAEDLSTLRAGLDRTCRCSILDAITAKGRGTVKASARNDVAAKLGALCQ